METTQPAATGAGSGERVAVGEVAKVPGMPQEPPRTQTQTCLPHTRTEAKQVVPGLPQAPRRGGPQSGTTDRLSSFSLAMVTGMLQELHNLPTTG